MSGNKVCYHLKCVARAATLREAPSRLRLSVRKPSRGCLPWCPKKRTVATFCFKEAHWQQGASGEYEQTAECGIKDLARLKRLAADLPVKVKYWTKGRPSKVLLQVSLGALLDQLENSPASEAWLAFTATGQEQRVCWQPAEHQDGACTDPPLSDDALGDSFDTPLEYDDLWDSDGQEILVEEDLTSKTLAPYVAEDGEGADEWVTFSNPSAGKTLWLPHHTEEETAAKWRGPGAWTSEDDLLSPRALRIVERTRPVVKRTQLPEGPHWWEQASIGTAAAAVAVTRPAERAKQQDASLLPPEWNQIAFPGYSASPRRRGGADAELPEVTLPVPSSCGGAEAGLPEVAVPALCRRRGGADAELPEMTPPAPCRYGGAARGSTGRPHPFLCVVVTLAYVIYVTWVITCGDDFLDAIAARLAG